MQIYEMLKKDHQEVRELLFNLISLEESDSSKHSDLIDRIRDALVPHSRAEETVFYNSLRSIDSAKDIIAHSYQEHLEAEALLRTLQVKDKIDADWKATAKKLKDALEHHIAEEEGKIFSVAKQLFTDEEAVMMAGAFERLKPEIQGEGIMATTAEFIANLMPARFAKAFSKYNLESRIAKH